MDNSQYYIYLIASNNNNALYTGVTNNLERRVYEHKSGLIKGFTQKYNCKKLVYYEVFGNIEPALLREKEIKGWRRSKKDQLINSRNPTWTDLTENNYQFPLDPSSLHSSG